MQSSRPRLPLYPEDAVCTLAFVRRPLFVTGARPEMRTNSSQGSYVDRLRDPRILLRTPLLIVHDVWCSSQECGSQPECSRYIHSPTPAERRRASSSVVGTASQSVHSIYRKRSSATSCHSAPATGNVDQVPGIHIQHIEALPYQVAVVTTDCGSSGRICDEGVVDSSASAVEPADKHRYIIIHNELSSVSSLSRSRSRSHSAHSSSKASSIVNINEFSSLEFDNNDSAAVTMTTTSSAAATGANRRRYSTRQVTLPFSINDSAFAADFTESLCKLSGR